jgi:hypothetical protein
MADRTASVHAEGFAAPAPTVTAQEQRRQSAAGAACRSQKLQVTVLMWLIQQVHLQFTMEASSKRSRWMA